MTHETPQQRRTRLIERYVEKNATLGTAETWLDIHTAIKLATELADEVIAATPQEPQSELQQDIERRRAEIKTRSCKPKIIEGFLTEFETRLLELCLEAKGIMKSPVVYDSEYHTKQSWTDKLDVLIEEMSLYGKV